MSLEIIARSSEPTKDVGGIISSVSGMEGLQNPITK